MDLIITPLLLAQLHMPPVQTREVTVKEVLSPNTFTVTEGFKVRIDCIKPIGDFNRGRISLMNLIMLGDPVTLEYTNIAIVSRVLAQGLSYTVDIGAAQVREGYAIADSNSCINKRR